jgi:hypothetical protein
VVYTYSKNDFSGLIKVRESALKYREKTESRFIKKMLKTKQFSPRTYLNKKHELEMWVTKEREELQNTKKVFVEQWKKTANLIEQTQQHTENIKKVMSKNKKSRSRSAKKTRRAYTTSISSNEKVL